jgi:hypothetical protein
MCTISLSSRFHDDTTSWRLAHLPLRVFILIFISFLPSYNCHKYGGTNGVPG